MIFLFSSERSLHVTDVTCNDIGYNLNVMRQSTCLVSNPIMFENYAAFFNCTPVGPWPRLKAFHFSWLGPELVFLLLRVSVSYSAPRDLHRRAAY